MKPTAELPVDPALPGIEAIRTLGLVRAIPQLELEEAAGEIRLIGYSPGARATLEAHVGPRHLAIKLYAYDPAPEAELYEALARAGLAGDAGPRVPPLLARQHDLQILVIGWLEGPTLHELVKLGKGARAGQLAADWMRCAAALPLSLGPKLGSARVLYRAGEWVADLVAADPGLGKTAKALARVLANTQPREQAPRLLHGTLYARHMLDLGDGPGLIDWERFGQGSFELDAGMFLATIWRIGLDHSALAGDAARAEQVFLTGTEGLLDERALAWHRAAALLRLAAKVRVVERRKPDWLARAEAQLREAMRLAERAAQLEPVEQRAEAPASAFKPNAAALELILRALATRPATPEELERIRKLLDETRHRAS